MFFYDSADFQKYIPINYNFVFEAISIYLKDTDRTLLKKYLGEDFTIELQNIFDEVTEIKNIPEAYSELIELIRVSTANFALASWLPLGQVNISQLGVSINSTENMKTAFQWQIKDIEETCRERGYTAFDDVLEYLEKNIDADEFATYKNSDEFAENKSLFVPSSKEFCKYFSLFENSRINFIKLRSTIVSVEDFDIKPVLLSDLFDDLKEKLQGTTALTDDEKNLIAKIKPAVVNLTVAKAINNLAIVINNKGLMTFDNTGGKQTQESQKHAPDNTLARIAHSAEHAGRAYLKQLADYLETNKTDYPIYTSDSTYTAPEDIADINDGDNPFFVGI